MPKTQIKKKGHKTLRWQEAKKSEGFYESLSSGNFFIAVTDQLAVGIQSHDGTLFRPDTTMDIRVREIDAELTLEID